MDSGKLLTVPYKIILLIYIKMTLLFKGANSTFKLFSRPMQFIIKGT